MDVMQTTSVESAGDWSSSMPLLRFLNDCYEDFAADDGGEVASYIPEITEHTDQRCATVNGKEHCARVIQTNNVDVDDRGYIYIVDRANTGMHILELTGAARQIANWPK